MRINLRSNHLSKLSNIEPKCKYNVDSFIKQSHWFIAIRPNKFVAAEKNEKPKIEQNQAPVSIFFCVWECFLNNEKSLAICRWVEQQHKHRQRIRLSHSGLYIFLFSCFSRFVYFSIPRNLFAIIIINMFYYCYTITHSLTTAWFGWVNINKVTL